jgi:methylthioribulose-1-phosphate dehydratase
VYKKNVETWEKAKIMTECYDYLFEIAVKMKSHNLDKLIDQNNTEDEASN